MAISDSTITILTTVLIDSLLCVGILALFLFYRKLRSIPTDVQVEDVNLKLPIYSESEHSIYSLLQKVYAMPLSEFAKLIGKLGGFFLQLNLILYYLLLVCLPMSFTLLIIYSQGSADLEDDEGTLGMAHVLNNNGILIFALILMVLYSVVAYFAYAEIYKAGIASQSLEKTIEQRSLSISNLPIMQCSELEKKVKEWFDDYYPTDITSIYAVPDWGPAHKAYKELVKATEKLKFYIKQYELTGERPVYKKFLIKKYDAINYFTEECQKHKQKVIDDTQNIDSGVGLVFVTFKDRQTMQDFLRHFKGAADELSSNRWVVDQAYAPSDYLWENLPYNLKSRFKQFLLSLTFFMIFLILLTPTALVGLIEALGIESLTSSLILAYTSTLVLLIYQEEILPLFIKFAIRWEAHPNKVAKRASGLSKFLNYSLVYVFLYPLVGLQVIELLNLLLESEEDWTDTFASSMNSSGLFFTIYIIHQLFITNATGLLNFGRYFKVEFKKFIASSEYDKVKAYKADSIKYDKEIARILTIFLVIFNFSIVYPVIVVPGVLCLASRYWVNKYNLLCFYHGRKDITIKEILYAVETRLIVYTFLFQILTAFVLTLSEETAFYTISLVILNSSIVFTAIVLIMMNYMKFERTENTEDTEQLLSEEDNETYSHPLVNFEADS